MVGAVVILIVVTAGMVSTTYVQFLKGSLLVIFSAVLTVMILNRGLRRCRIATDIAVAYDPARFAAIERSAAIEAGT